MRSLAAGVGGREFADAGCLVSYSENLEEMHRRAATYLDRILGQELGNGDERKGSGSGLTGAPPRQGEWGDPTSEDRTWSSGPGVAVSERKVWERRAEALNASTESDRTRRRHSVQGGGILWRHPLLEGDTARARDFQPGAGGRWEAHVGGKASVVAVKADELLEVGEDSYSVVRGRTTSYSLRSPANLKRSHGGLPNLPKYQAS